MCIIKSVGDILFVIDGGNNAEIMARIEEVPPHPPHDYVPLLHIVARVLTIKGSPGENQ
ncbi:hypothetical protein C5167_036150 [Papaver somniferum]|nr:hypothetical protein C5167_036150 [Papaver somniferum]